MSSLANVQTALANADEVFRLASTTTITRGEDAEEIKTAISFMKYKLEMTQGHGYWGTPGSELLASSFRTFAGACADALHSAAKAVSPAGVVLCSGALARRLQTNFKFIGVTIRQLDRAIECTSSGNGISSAYADTGGSRGGGAKLDSHFGWTPKLRVLHQRAARAQVLRRLLESDWGLEPVATAAALSSGGGGVAGGASSAAGAATITSRAANAESVGSRPLDRARAVSSVRLALQGEGMTAAALAHPQAVAELVNELYDLANESRLVYQEDQQLINAVAGVLLHGIELRGGRGNSSSRVTSQAVGSAAAGGPPQPPAAPSAPAVTSLPQSCVCPLTLQLLRDPVVTAAGHTYERADAEEWLRRNDTDPKTRARLSSRTLIPNWALKGVIDELLAERGLDHELYDELVSSGCVDAARAGAGGAAAAATAAGGGGGGRSTGAAAAGSGRVPSAPAGAVAAAAGRGLPSTAATAATAARGQGPTPTSAAEFVPTTASQPGPSTAAAPRSVDAPAAPGGGSHPAAPRGSGLGPTFSLGFPPLGPSTSRHRHRANRWSAADATTSAPPAHAPAAAEPSSGADEAPLTRNPAAPFGWKPSFKWSRPLAETGGAAAGNGASGSGALRTGPSGSGPSGSGAAQGLDIGDRAAGRAPVFGGASRFGPPPGGAGSGSSGAVSAALPSAPQQPGTGAGGARRGKAVVQPPALPAGRTPGGGSSGAPSNQAQPTVRASAPAATVAGGRVPASTGGMARQGSAAAPAPAVVAADHDSSDDDDDDDDADDDYVGEAMRYSLMSFVQSLRSARSATALTNGRSGTVAAGTLTGAAGAARGSRTASAASPAEAQADGSMYGLRPRRGTKRHR